MPRRWQEVREEARGAVDQAAPPCWTPERTGQEAVYCVPEYAGRAPGADPGVSPVNPHVRVGAAAGPYRREETEAMARAEAVFRDDGAVRMWRIVAWNPDHANHLVVEELKGVQYGTLIEIVEFKK